MTNELIIKYINSNSSNLEKIKKSRGLYECDVNYLDISNKVSNNIGKANNKLHVDFASKIVDLKANYISSNPALINIRNYDSNNINDVNFRESIDFFRLVNNFDLINARITQEIGAVGKTYVILSNESDGLGGYFDKMTVIPAEEIIKVNDNKFIRSYMINDIEKGEVVNYVDLYDNDKIYSYELHNKTLTYIGEIIHTYKLCPVIEYKNNHGDRSDVYNVLTLMSAYDKLLSINTDDEENLSNAFLLVKGIINTEDGQAYDDEGNPLYSEEELALNFTDVLKQSGMINLNGEHDDAKFLTKQSNKDMIEFMLDKLEQLIYSTAKSLDPDKMAEGQMTQNALQHRTQALDSKAKETVRYLSMGWRNLFKVLFTKWNIIGKTYGFNYLDIEVQYTLNSANRNNLLEQVEILSKAGLKMPQKVLAKLFSEVDDVEEFIRLQNEELEEELSKTSEAFTINTK